MLGDLWRRGLWHSPSRVKEANRPGTSPKLPKKQHLDLFDKADVE
jgi:hypothetical protein